MLKSVLFVAGGDEYIERQIHQQLLQLSIPVTDVRGVVGLWLNEDTKELNTSTNIEILSNPQWSDDKAQDGIRN